MLEIECYIEHDGVGVFPMPHIPGLPNIEGSDEKTHSPRIGEHSVEILHEWGYNEETISTMLKNKIAYCSLKQSVNCDT